LPTSSEVRSEDTLDNNTPYPSSVEDTCLWLTERPFKTLQRAMHLAFPDTTRWWFDEAEPLPDAETAANRALWRTYLWRFHPDELQGTWWRDVPDSSSGVKMEPAPCNSMVFIVQPPWILALQDMNNLAKCTNVSTPASCLLPTLTLCSRSCPRYQMTTSLLRAGSIALNVYGQIFLTLANTMIVMILFSRHIMGGCLARSPKIGHQRGSAR
jgi:hypothetical protein